VEVDKKKAEIYADPLRLKEILFNLIGNAIKFTEEGGITLKITEKKNFWLFDVIDTGVGIKEENLSKIFKEFFRGNDRKTGTGLGLPLSKRLINLHGGNIAVKSKLEEGSRFSFTIPKK
jgi:signal transduction histidine kinase